MNFKHDLKIIFIKNILSLQLEQDTLGIFFQTELQGEILHMFYIKYLIFTQVFCGSLLNKKKLF